MNPTFPICNPFFQSLMYLPLKHDISSYGKSIVPTDGENQKSVPTLTVNLKLPWDKRSVPMCQVNVGRVSVLCLQYITKGRGHSGKNMISMSRDHQFAPQPLNLGTRFCMTHWPYRKWYPRLTLGLHCRVYLVEPERKPRKTIKSCFCPFYQGLWGFCLPVLSSPQCMEQKNGQQPHKYVALTAIIKIWWGICVFFPLRMCRTCLS